MFTRVWTVASFFTGNEDLDVADTYRSVLCWHDISPSVVLWLCEGTENYRNILTLLTPLVNVRVMAGLEHGGDKKRRTRRSARMYILRIAIP